MRAMILAEAYRTVTFTEGDMEFDLPAGQAVLRAMMVNAVKGNRTPAVALHADRAGGGAAAEGGARGAVQCVRAAGVRAEEGRRDAG